MEGKKRTEIAEIGKFGLIERICSRVEPQNASTVKGCGDDTAVIDAGDRYVLLSTELLLEGVHFDLTYYPLQHLGYKAVVAGISDILAMNGTPRQIELALGIPARFSVEMTGYERPATVTGPIWQAETRQPRSTDSQSA